MNEGLKNQPETKKGQLTALYKLLEDKLEDLKEPLQFPLNVAGNDVIISFWGDLGDGIQFGIFTGEQKYSRKTIHIDKNGNVGEDLEGVLPDFDRTENEPDFSSKPNEEIAFQVLSKVVDILYS